MSTYAHAAGPKAPVPVSVLVLTKNEERDLPGCLGCLGWSDDVHVFDSGSTDKTLEVARDFGAKITERIYPAGAPAFGGDEAAHRNWGLQNIPFKYRWVFAIDADERVTPALAESIAAAVCEPQGNVAFRVQRRDFFLGTWLRHVQATPYYVRLFKPDCVKHSRLINTVSLVDGSVADISGYLDHFPFSKGLDHWISRHNGYSAFEAEQIVANRGVADQLSWIKAFTESDFHKRRFQQKELFYRLPFRPIVKFLLLYVGKRGFLDGRAGLTYATLQAIYEYFICLKVREIESNTGVKRKVAR